MSPKSIPSLFSLSGASSLTSIISTSTPTALSGTTSPTFSITKTKTRRTTPPEEFIFPIPFNGNPSETLPLLRNQPKACKSCNCNCKCLNPHTHTVKNTSTTQPSIRYRYCSTHRSSLLNIQIISGVLFPFCIAITILSPFSKKGTTENNPSTPEQAQQESLKSLHTNPSNSSIQTQTRKLDTAQLKGIEIAILYFSIFVICSVIRVTSYAVSRRGLCFVGEGSNGRGVGFEEEEEMMGYGMRRELTVDDMV